MDKQTEFIVLGLLTLAGLAAGIAAQAYFKNPTSGSRRAKSRTLPGASIRVGDRSNAPVASYLKYPLGLCWLFGITGMMGAAVGSGGTIEGFAVAIFLNPYLWAAIYFWTRIGAIRCPHCRATALSESIKREPVGAIVECQTCHNCFTKPLA